jgi:SAM-dependent methyltransferase
VLDLGAGTGQFAAAIAGWFGVEVVAVEPSGGMRAQAARAHPHPGVRWVAGVAERLPLGAGFPTEALQQVDQVSATSLAAYRDKVRLRADTGLALLPDEEFAAGLAALDRAVEAETTPAPVVDRIDLLVLGRSGPGG